MAIFEDKKQEVSTYVALLDNEGNLVAFIQPVKGVSQELITEAMREKGLNVELRESKEARLSLTL